MKTNKIMRIASVLLVAVMLSTCAISGTFAKYTSTNSGSDTGTVANWGITVNGEPVQGIFSKTYNNGSSVQTVNASADAIAPGTTGSFVYPTFTNTAEVSTESTYATSITLTGFDTYCPIIFTVGGTQYYVGGAKTGGAVSGEAEAITTASELATIVGTAAAGNTAPTVTWTWNFSGTDFPVADYQTDAKDTSLGNADTKATIAVTLTLTVDQVD